MFLDLKNIGKIEQASVEIKGITVIAGENDTGKSTVGKVLYSIFNSFYNVNEQIQQQKRETINNILVLLQFALSNKNISFKTNNLTDVLLSNQNKYSTRPDELRTDISTSISKETNPHIEAVDINNDILTKIFDVFNITNEKFLDKVLTSRFREEFASQINNIYSEEIGTISLKIKGKSIDIHANGNNIYVVKKQIDLLNTEIVYIDNPFVLDEMRAPFRYNIFEHKRDLKYRLYYPKDKRNVFNEILTDDKLKDIYSQINDICVGELEISDFRTVYRKPGSDKVLNVKNISTGLKTFVILKTLLQNSWIEELGTIILDEPEIHLHPEWQLLFAKIIVLLQKTFNLHILLTTHSPYFLNAIEVYSNKYGIDNRCKYYLAKNIKDETAVIEDVTDNTEKIYAKLARPLQELENEAYND